MGVSQWLIMDILPSIILPWRGQVRDEFIVMETLLTWYYLDVFIYTVTGRGKRRIRVAFSVSCAPVYINPLFAFSSYGWYMILYTILVASIKK